MAFLVTATVSSAEPTAAQLRFFETKIRPVLVEHCYKCHSAKSAKVKGQLLLDSQAGTLKGGESGPAIVAGDVDDSLLIQAIRYESFEMPPKEQLPANVIADFEKWVGMGAPDPRSGAVTIIRESIDFDEARKFWSFKPPRQTDPPSIQDATWPQDDIDRFVYARLLANGLQPAADADRLSWIRRVYFDLIGLPPTPEEVTAFIEDRSTTAVEAVVDHLLDSLHFGERWGRHWLDVARYAESNGRERNFLFPHAWRYRDYVIAALNKDKPYDRFIQEQIAGDLLPRRDGDDENELKIATGFLAIGGKLLNERNREIFRMDRVDEQIDVTTRAVMALTVSCARCHNHKFDPIPTADYYSLAGIFRSTDVYYGTGGGGNRQASKLIALEDGDEQANQAVAKHAQAVKAAERQLRKSQAELREMNKSGDRKKIGPLRRKVKQQNLRLTRLKKEGPAANSVAMGVVEGSVENCRIYIRGEVDNPANEVPRGYLTILSPAAAHRVTGDQSGRLDLAKWLTSPENPLTSRVLVNRVWHHLFGRGLVRTTDNFGATGEKPSHPELLDFLAVQVQRDGWSVKRLIRSIVLSRTYAMSTEFDVKKYEQDPQNILLWRMSPRRLDAESLRDAMLAASGQLDRQPGVASTVAKFKDTQSIGRGVTPASFNTPSNHRSVYLPIVRNAVPEVLRVFDFAEPSIIVGQRDITTVPAQALYMMNSPFVIEQSKHTAQRVLANGSLDDAGRIELIYRSILARGPSESERTRALGFIESTITQLETNQSTEARAAVAWSGLCQALFACAEFRYLN
jgi:cytochrome c553